MACCRDHQRSKVYAWERAIIAPRDTTPVVPFERAQLLIDGVWLMEGLFYPPRVVPLNPQATTKWATGCRLEISLRQHEPTPTWVILHEIAHALVQDDAHGPDYVGLYMGLLDRHLKIPQPMLMWTAAQAGVQFNLGVKPRLVEAHNG